LVPIESSYTVDDFLSDYLLSCTVSKL